MSAREQGSACGGISVEDCTRQMDDMVVCSGSGFLAAHFVNWVVGLSIN